MFEFIKRKKAAKEFQTKYNLSKAEMSQITFMKAPITNEYFGRLNTNNFDLYKKINRLNSILEKKLNNAKEKFVDLINRFNKEEIFNSYKEACYEDLNDFLYLFSYNSSKIRISYTPDTPAEVIQQVWDKVDLFLDAICAYYLLQLDDELVEYSKVTICAILKLLLQKDKIEFNQNYAEIRSYVIERAKSEALSTTAKYLSNDWYKASIVNG